MKSNGHVWDQRTGRWYPESSGVPGPVVSVVTGPSGAVFRCNDLPCETLDACTHIMRYFQDFQDIGEHTNFEHGKVFPRLGVPISFGSTASCSRNLVQNPVRSDEKLLEISSEVCGVNIQALLGKEDGLIKFIRMLRDEAMASVIFGHTMSALEHKLRLPCNSGHHKAVQDRETTRIVSDYARQTIDSNYHPQSAPKWNVGLLRPAFTELAIDNAFFMSLKGMCAACFRCRISPSNVPADLIPSV